MFTSGNILFTGRERRKPPREVDDEKVSSDVRYVVVGGLFILSLCGLQLLFGHRIQRLILLPLFGLLLFISVLVRQPEPEPVFLVSLLP